MIELSWHPDQTTEYWAKKLPLPIKSKRPIPQYDGMDYRMREDTWVKHILQDQFPDYCRYPGFEGSLLCSPGNIMHCFRDQMVLEGLALTVAWGRMTRSKGNIYTKSNKVIEKTLLDCLSSIEATDSVKDSWNLLVGELGWSNVITSKCLHFLARSSGYSSNPPVPIDNKVIIKRVWPAFEKIIANNFNQAAEKFPQEWWDNHTSWEAYNRYMTAVICWASHIDWTTTQLENTIFQEYYPGDKSK